jgi:hypothetical protein
MFRTYPSVQNNNNKSLSTSVQKGNQSSLGGDLDPPMPIASSIKRK